MSALMAGTAHSADDNVEADPDEPMEYLGSLKILADDCVGYRWMYEGVLLECDDEPRVVAVRDNTRSPGKRKSGGSFSETVAIDLTMADNTGPVNFTFWDDAARSLVELLPADRGSQYIHLENLKVSNVSKNEWNGTILTNLKIVHSVATLPQRDGARIRLTSSLTVTSPFLRDISYTIPGNAIAIRNFSSPRMSLVAPFKATLIGTVANAGTLDVTAIGHAKRTFDLVDDQGAWMKCLAVGRNANSLSLEDGVQVVLYSCNGRPGSSTLTATIMLAHGSVIVPTGSKKLIQKRSFIDISRG